MSRLLGGAWVLLMFAMVCWLVATIWLWANYPLTVIQQPTTTTTTTAPCHRGAPWC